MTTPQLITHLRHVDLAVPDFDREVSFFQSTWGLTKVADDSKTVTYQEVSDAESAAFLGRLCGRAARVELFEGHARSGDLRAARAAGDPLPWAPADSLFHTADKGEA